MPTGSGNPCEIWMCWSCCDEENFPVEELQRVESDGLCHKQALTVMNDSYITAIQGCQMLEKIAVTYAGKTVYVMLDNAHYQKFRIIMERAEQLGIVLDYIPRFHNRCVTYR